MLESLNGATRVYFIVGHPIAQVKSPAGITGAFAQHQHNAVVVPIDVMPADLERFVAGLAAVRNVDGLLVTVPHKFAVFGLCSTATPRARVLVAANVVRRNADGSWHGDMLDGAGFVRGLRAGGCAPQGLRALLVGAGGAGGAIGLELLDAGVAELSIHDQDATRRDALLLRLRDATDALLTTGSDDPDGYDLVVNATPMGMRASDPLPVRVERLSPATFVGDVITLPEVTPLLAAARARGCRTTTGVDMFNAQRALLVDFLLREAGTETGPRAGA